MSELTVFPWWFKKKIVYWKRRHAGTVQISRGERIAEFWRGERKYPMSHKGFAKKRASFWLQRFRKTAGPSARRKH